VTQLPGGVEFSRPGEPATLGRMARPSLRSSPKVAAIAAEVPDSYQLVAAYNYNWRGAGSRQKKPLETTYFYKKGDRNPAFDEQSRTHSTN